MRVTWKWRAAGLGVLLLSLCALTPGAVYLNWASTRERGEIARDEVVRRLDAEEPGWRVADLCRERNDRLPRDGEHAAARIVVAYNLLPQSYRDWQSKNYDLRRGARELGVIPPDGETRELLAALAQSDASLTAARSVRSLPPGGHVLIIQEDKPIGTSLWHVDQSRSVQRLLENDATARCLGGRPDDAIESVLAMLACARAIGDEPTLTSQLVRIAMTEDAVRTVERVLGWGQPTRGLGGLQAELLSERDVPRLTYGFRGERAIAYETVECIDRRQIPLRELRRSYTGLPGNRVEFVLYRKHLPAQQARLAESYTEALAAERKCGSERWDAYEAVRHAIPPVGEGTELVNCFMPRLTAVVVREDRLRALLSCAVVGLACERYRHSHGRWPERLEQIPKDILPIVPSDPFSGSPPLYRREADGIVVTSVRPPARLAADVADTPTENVRSAVEFWVLNPDRRGRPSTVADGVQ